MRGYFRAVLPDVAALAYVKVAVVRLLKIGPYM